MERARWGSAEDEDVGDRALLRRLYTRDLTALAALYDRHGAAAYQLACRLLGRSPAAEDAVAAVFFGVWRQTVPPPAAPTAVRCWLLGLVWQVAVVPDDRAWMPQPPAGNQRAASGPAAPR
jgi:hypothetical protein